MPIPSTVTSTTSPATSGPTPAGVPVRITSPGSIVITEVTNSIRKAQSKIICAVLPSCLVAPFTRVPMARCDGSSSVSMHGPSGQKVSKPLPRVNCTSFFWRSRAVTSFAQV